MTLHSVLIHEDELIDEYFGGACRRQEREAFERHFLTAPERRQKLGFARSLTKYVEASRQQKSPLTQPSFVKALMALLRVQQPAVQYSFAAIALVLTVGISWPIVEVRRLQTEVGANAGPPDYVSDCVNGLSQQISEAQKRSQDLMEQLGQQQQSRSALEEQLASMQRPAIVSFPLTPGLVRDFGSMKKLIIPPAAKLVELSLAVDGENYDNYRAALQGASGEEVLSLNRLSIHEEKWDRH